MSILIIAKQSVFSILLLPLHHTILLSFKHSGIDHFCTSLMSLKRKKQLIHLDVTGNNITVLESSSPKLFSLMLSQNNIKILSKSIFHGLSKLRHLDISKNYLRELLSTVFQGINVEDAISRFFLAFPPKTLCIFTHNHSHFQDLQCTPVYIGMLYTIGKLRKCASH